MYAFKKAWLRYKFGPGPRLTPMLANTVRSRLGLVINRSLNFEVGLCTAVKYAFDTSIADRHLLNKWLAHQFKLWPHYSGSRNFPVRHSTKTPALAYHTERLYLGEYGAMRLKLAKHLLAAAELDAGIKR